MKNTAELIKESVDICYENVSTDKLTRAAEWIFHSSHLFLYGVGDSYISALSFANQMTKLGISSVLPMQFNESLAISATAKKDDIALILSYSGNMEKALAREIHVLHQNNCRIIMVSSVTSSSASDLLLNFPQREELQGKIGIYYSQAAFQYVMGSLYGMIYSMDYTNNRIRKLTQERISNPAD